MEDFKSRACLNLTGWAGLGFLYHPFVPQAFSSCLQMTPSGRGSTGILVMFTSDLKWAWQHNRIGQAVTERYVLPSVWMLRDGVWIFVYL